MGVPSPRWRPKILGHGTSASSAPAAPHSPPLWRVFQLSGWVSGPLGNGRAAVACLGSAGYSSLPGGWWVWQQPAGFRADVWLHFPPGHLFSWCRKKKPCSPPPAPPPPPLPLLSLDGARWGDSRGAGAPLGEVEPAPSQAWPRQLRARRWDRCQAWRGGWGGRGDILAPCDWPPLGRRSRRALTRGVCVWMGGPPGLCRETSLAPTVSLPAGLFGSPSFQAGNATVFCFDF